MHASVFCVITICHGGNGGMGLFFSPRSSGTPLMHACLPSGAAFLFTAGEKKVKIMLFL